MRSRRDQLRSGNRLLSGPVPRGFPGARDGAVIVSPVTIEGPWLRLGVGRMIETYLDVAYLDVACLDNERRPKPSRPQPNRQITGHGDTPIAQGCPKTSVR